MPELQWLNSEDHLTGNQRTPVQALAGSLTLGMTNSEDKKMTACLCLMS